MAYSSHVVLYFTSELLDRKYAACALKYCVNPIKPKVFQNLKSANLENLYFIKKTIINCGIKKF